MTVDSMYSISVTSKFKLFYEDVEEGEDPNDMLTRLEAEAKLKSKTKPDKSEKKKPGKDIPKKPDSKENASTRIEKPADKKGKRPEKKDGEKPPRFANRQNRDGESGQRDDMEGEQRENSGPPRGRGGYRGDRGGNRGGYRGRGGGFRGGRDGQGQRPPNGHGPSDEWSVQNYENQSDSWGGPVNENDSEKRNEERSYRGGGRGGQGGFGRGGGYSGFSGRGGGGFRGGRGGQRGGYRNAGREYERHSGSYKTGVKPIDKRDGAGAHNWGTMKDELDVSTNEGTEGQTVEWTNKEVVAPAGVQPEAADEQAAAVPVVEEGVEEDAATAPETSAPITMTLDEYRAQQAKKKLELHESLKISKIDDATRKINDGQDAFKNMVRYQKERLMDDDEEEEEEEDEDEEDEDPHRSKQIVIDVRFSDAPRRGGRFTGERGGRGRGGGNDRGRGSGGFRGGRGGNFRGGYDRAETRPFSSERPRSQQAQIRLNDENDFPSLK